MRDLNTPLSNSIFDTEKKKKVKAGKSPVSGRDAFKLKQREASMRNEIKENAANSDSKKRKAAKAQNQADSSLRRKSAAAAKRKGGKTGYGK